MIRADLHTRWRFPLMLLAGLALLSALWAALARIGWSLPALPAPIAGQHGPLMISGFLGTLIGLERAVALNRRWMIAAPLLSGLGTFALLVGLPAVLGRSLIALAALGLTIAVIAMYRRQPATFTATMALGALLWLVGSALWWSGWPTPRVVPWWAGFLVLTIAGERLELARVLMPGRAARTAFALAVGLFLAGLLVSLLDFERGFALCGVGLIAIGVWLLRYDIARRTIRASGLTRFIAACLLPGYAWLIAAGGLWLAFGGGHTSGFIYDAMLHGVFLGFVFSMIFGHAPIILPAVLNLDMAFRPIFYAHLVLLHVSLVARIAGDLLGQPSLRMWGGLFNVVAILAFLFVMIRTVLSKTKS